MELSEEEKLIEAEQYHLKAGHILHQLQANKQVFGSNSALTGANPANVDLALQYINRSLKLYPENAVYLNLKALLLWEGKGDKESARRLLEKAAELKPRDIDIQNNLNAIKTSQCFVATAAFGSPVATELHVLRRWRDEILSCSSAGRLFVAGYYRFGSSAARAIDRHPFVKPLVRSLLRAVICIVGRR